MIILTQPNIAKLGSHVTKISSTVKVGETWEYCLAEVPDNFTISGSKMKWFGFDFWYPLTESFVDASKYKLRKYKGGIVEGVLEQIGLSKEINIAYSIFAIAANRKADVWQIWERSIKN